MDERGRERMLLDHGAKLLEERIAFFDGRSNPIRNFSVNQLQKAIHDFQKNHHVQSLIDFEWSKGVLDGRFVFVRKYAMGGEEVYRAAISVTGMLLIEYVKDLVEKDQINEVVDPTISGEDRPLMIEVEKEIQRIERSITAL
ncbi:unnamed protein product [Dovyalis caffra]|uniref:Uncharacterized protein n=1 Tax=Dovyalis caffra TaxID=77055 RepID=A0AAV1S541_9ROSI|nr:unnamed protein product [Dovyalis caffra]